MRIELGRLPIEADGKDHLPVVVRSTVLGDIGSTGVLRLTDVLDRPVAPIHLDLGKYGVDIEKQDGDEDDDLA